MDRMRGEIPSFYSGGDIMNVAREVAQEYYGTDTQRLAMDKTNIPSGTRFLVFDADTKAFVRAYIFVEGINDWCTM
jgi:hypothetical protein